MKYICPKCKEREGVEYFIGCLQLAGMPDRICNKCSHTWDIVRRNKKTKPSCIIIPFPNKRKD
jgi:hypothetical protein